MVGGRPLGKGDPGEWQQWRTPSPKHPCLLSHARGPQQRGPHGVRRVAPSSCDSAGLGLHRWRRTIPQRPGDPRFKTPCPMPLLSTAPANPASVFSACLPIEFFRLRRRRCRRPESAVQSVGAGAGEAAGPPRRPEPWPQCVACSRWSPANFAVRRFGECSAASRIRDKRRGLNRRRESCRTTSAGKGAARHNGRRPTAASGHRIQCTMCTYKPRDQSTRRVTPRQRPA